MKIILNFRIILILVIGASAHASAPPTSFRLEIGAAGTGYNYFRIPNNSANSRFDLPEGDFIPAFRLYASLPVSENWNLRFLFAPLKVNYKYRSSSTTTFQNASFAADTDLDVGYQFNSYRASIIRNISVNDQFKWHWGFTAKVRDAFISVASSTTNARKDDLGFVPLLNLGLDWTFYKDFVLSFDLDGLAGGPGRAFDGRLDVQKSVSESWTLGLGYRFVEGGANVEQVNNFAYFHQVFASVTYSL